MKSRTVRIQVSLDPFCQHLLSELQRDLRCESTSQTIEWLILCQRFSRPEAEALLQRKRKRGERIAVTVLPEDAVLPPEG